MTNHPNRSKITPITLVSMPEGEIKLATKVMHRGRCLITITGADVDTRRRVARTIQKKVQGWSNLL